MKHEDFWLAGREQDPHGSQIRRSPGQDRVSTRQGRISPHFIQGKGRIHLQMETRNNKAPRAAVKQCHSAPWRCLTLWSKTQLETVQKQTQQTGISPCPLRFFDSWWLGAEDTPSFCSHGAWGKAAHPPACPSPLRS